MEKIGRFSFEFGLWITTFAMINVVTASLMIVVSILYAILGDGAIFETLASMTVLALGAILAVGHFRASYFISKNASELFNRKYPKIQDSYFWGWIGSLTRLKLDWIFIKYTFNFKRADKEVLLSV